MKDLFQIKTNILTATTTTTYQKAMWDLYTNYYQTDADAFFSRFKSNDLYALYTLGKELVGFTGLRVRTIETENGPCQTIYVGQTVMRADVRGKSLLPRTCSLLIFRQFLRNPFRPVYIWCDSLTYKPYLLFANSLSEYYPCPQQETPAIVKTLIGQLGQHYYGGSFNEQTGTVSKSKNIINDPSTFISDEGRQHPAIDFFARANPGHTKGDGLITIAPMHYANFIFLVRKCVRKLFGKK